MARTPRIAVSKSKNHPASFELYTPSERTREDQDFFSALGPTTHVLNVFLLKSNPIMDSHGVYEELSLALLYLFQNITLPWAKHYSLTIYCKNQKFLLNSSTLRNA